MNNVQEMIAAFQDWKEKGDFSEQVNDDLLRYFLDRSTKPTWQNIVWNNDTVTHVNNREINRKTIKDAPTTDLEKSEIKEVQDLLDSVIWESYEDLMALVIKYPPVLLEQSLIVGFVIYMLRAEDAELDSDTESFTEFYRGWQAVVCEACKRF